MSQIEKLSGIGLGTAQFAFKDGSREKSITTVIAALEAGVRIIDTALAYTRVDEVSSAESIVHDALLQCGSPADVLVATKGGHWRRGDEFPVDGSASALRANCEISLRVLGVERIDLYQLHHVDPDVPLEDSVATLQQLRAEGKINQIGLSNVSIEQLENASKVAQISSVQNRLSYARLEDLPTLRRCAELGIRYLAYLPLDGPGAVIDPSDPRALIAQDRGISVQSLTLAWLLRLSSAIIPLVGSSRPETITDSARSIHLELSSEDVETITAAAEKRSEAN